MSTDTSSRSVAETLVTGLAELGVEVIFLNPGTDTAPVQEAVRSLSARGERVPRVVLCLYENVAMAAAHAYYAVTGRPQVVMVHVDVGTQNLGAMVHNAMRAEVGVLVIAGRTPATAYGELPGGRDATVHWHQDVPDQAGIVRPYVKWTGELSAATPLRTVTRALQVAATAPAGPVYLTAEREVLMQPATAENVPPQRYRAPIPPAPDAEAIAKAARLLADAERPVVITTRVGQKPAGVPALVEVAERTGAVVIDQRERVNFPSSHDGYLLNAAQAAESLANADVVLLADAPVPWIPAHGAPAESATVISLELDPAQASMPYWSYPVDLAMQCDPVRGLQALAAELGRIVPKTPVQPWVTRQPAAATPTEAGQLISAADVARVVNGLIGAEDIVIEEATTNAELIRGALGRDVPATYFRAGGSGLGWGLGASLGVALAAPAGRRVVTLVGDGAFVFGVPTAALTAMAAAEVASVIVVLRNGGYAASRAPVIRLFPDGRSVADGDVTGTLFATNPDLAALARASGAYGGYATSAQEVEKEVSAALDRLADGVSSVIVVPVTSPWIPTAVSESTGHHA